MNLNDGGAGYLGPGKYTAEITRVAEVVAKTGTQGTIVIFRDVETGDLVRERFWHTTADGKPSKARYRMRVLADVCGFDKKARETFEPKDLIGKRCIITVVAGQNDPKYCEVQNVEKIGSAALIPPMLAPKEPPEDTGPEPPREPGEDPADIQAEADKSGFDKDSDIPF